MSIYLGKSRVSIKYNASNKPGPSPVDPDDSYQNVITKINFCKDVFRNENEKSVYAGAWIALRDDSADYEEFTLSTTGVVAIKTSDGKFYSVDNGTSVDHLWDSSKDITIEGLVNEKYRWVIYYYASDTINSNSQDLDCLKTYNIIYVFDIDVKYLIASPSSTNAGGVFRMNDVIQGFDFINEHKCTVSNSNKTSFLHFCNGCRSLVVMSDSIDTTTIQNFNYFCYSCVSIIKLPNTIDFSNGISFNNFCANCHLLKSLPDSMNIEKGTDFTSFCNGAYSLEKLPSHWKFSSAINMGTFCGNCYSLQYLPDEMNVEKVTNFTQFCSSCRSLKRLPHTFNTINGNSFEQFCYSCYALRYLPNGLNISKAQKFNYFCTYCYSLMHCDEVLDFSSGTNFSQLFEQCYSMVNFKIILPPSSFSIKYASHLSIASLKYMSDNAPTVTSCTLTIGSTNIARANKYDPTIISNLNAKGWTVN